MSHFTCGLVAVSAVPGLWGYKLRTLCGSGGSDPNVPLFASPFWTAGKREADMTFEPGGCSK